MILHNSSIAVFKDSDGKTGSISSNYFPVLMTVTRKQFDADPTSKLKEKCVLYNWTCDKRIGLVAGL